MINEREIDYAVSVVQNEVQYFLRYKNNLKKFSIENRGKISRINMNKIFNEIERITLHIQKLKQDEKELLKTLDKFYYGNANE